MSRLCFAVAVALAATATVLACSRFAEAVDEPLPAGDASDDVLAREASVVLPEPGACPAGAFCDSFDNGAPRMEWGPLKTTGAATLVVVGDAGLAGSGGLVMEASASGATKSAFLRYEKGPVPEIYEAVVAFWARVPSSMKFLLGPRFSTMSSDGTKVDIIVDFENGRVRLDQNPSPQTCDGGCGTIVNTATKVDTEWHWYVLTASVHPTVGAGDHGDVTLALDRNVIASSKLPFAMSSKKAGIVEVGLTYAGADGAGKVVFDDLTFAVKTP